MNGFALIMVGCLGALLGKGVTAWGQEFWLRQIKRRRYISYKTCKGLFDVIRAGGMGIIGILLYHQFGVTLFFLWACVVVLLVWLIAEIDIKLKIVPNLIVIWLLGINVLQAFFIPLHEFLSTLGAVAMAIVFLLGIRQLGYIVYGVPGMGMGDVKLLAVLAISFGGQVFWIIWVAAVAGVIDVFTGWVLGRKYTSAQIPFAPFIWVGMVVVLLASNFFGFSMG